MPGEPARKVLDGSFKLYRRLLVFYPAEHRRTYGSWMAQLFRDQLGEAYHTRGVRGLAGVWARTLYDLGVTVVAEQMAIANRARLVRVALCLLAGWIALIGVLQATRPPAHTALRAGRAVRAVALSPDGRTLAAGTMWGGTQVWDTSSGRRQHALAQASRSLVYSVAFSPDGRMLASSTPCGSLGCVQLWDAATGQLVQSIEGHARGVQVKDRERGMRRTALPGDAVQVRFSPDGRTLASAGSDGAIELRDGSSGKLVRVISDRATVRGLAFSPDGCTLAAYQGGQVRLWDVDSGALVRTIRGPADVVSDLAYSPDGRTLAWGEADRHARLWDAASGQLLYEFAQDARITSLAFRPDGRVLAVGGSDNRIRLWDLDARQLLDTVRAHRWDPFDNGVSALVFFPDGDTLVSAGEDGRVVLWDLSEG